MTRQSKTLPDAVKHFRDLPDEARIPADAVAALFAISGRTLNRRLQQGVIPAPVSQSPRTFNVADIRRALRG